MTHFSSNSFGPPISIFGPFWEPDTKFDRELQKTYTSFFFESLYDAATMSIILSQAYRAIKWAFPDLRDFIPRRGFLTVDTNFLVTVVITHVALAIVGQLEWLGPHLVAGILALLLSPFYHSEELAQGTEHNQTNKSEQTDAAVQATASEDISVLLQSNNLTQISERIKSMTKATRTTSVQPGRVAEPEDSINKETPTVPDKVTKSEKTINQLKPAVPEKSIEPTNPVGYPTPLGSPEQKEAGEQTQSSELEKSAEPASSRQLPKPPVQKRVPEATKSPNLRSLLPSAPGNAAESKHPAKSAEPVTPAETSPLLKPSPPEQTPENLESSESEDPTSKTKAILKPTQSPGIGKSPESKVSPAPAQVTKPEKTSEVTKTVPNSAEFSELGRPSAAPEKPPIKPTASTVQPEDFPEPEELPALPKTPNQVETLASAEPHKAARARQTAKLMESVKIIKPEDGRRRATAHASGAVKPSDSTEAPKSAGLPQPVKSPRPEERSRPSTSYGPGEEGPFDHRKLPDELLLKF